MLLISDAYAQTAGTAPGGAGNGLMSFLPIILMFVVLWFIMIRPQISAKRK
ncbi:Protein translocase subunit YajC [Ralstonia solanacearum UW551]|uniref:Protein translocase subunit YajC n=1 Tax=Ralstonia solanacearum (strain UW551) TaxID=342110 RepID=A0AB33VGS0_RALSU|nr:Protein translocase subunit YajC [Ralstonia solanacearum UW551]